MSGIWTAVATAAVGAYGANRSASAAKKASKGAGSVDMTSERTPWGPSAPLREDLMQRAYNIGTVQPPTFDAWQGGRGGAAATGPGGKKKGKGAGKGGGGGQGKPAGDGFNGVSSQTNQVRDAMIGNAQAGNPLYGEAEGYISDNLAGADRNAYRSETFDALRDVDDPDLRRMKDYLFEQLENGGRGGAGGGNRTYYVNPNYASAGPGGAAGGASTEGPVGAAGYIKDILNEKYLKEGNPYLEQRVKDALADSQEAFASTVIPGLNSEYAGSGMFGSSMYQNALAETGEQQARGLAREANAFRSEDFDKRMGDLMQALGYGTQMDMQAADLQAEAASRGGGGGGDGGQGALDLQRQAMILNALGGAVGEGVDLRQFGLSGMGDLAKDFSSDQRFSLGGVPDITGLSLRDWSGAGDLSLGADQNRSQFQLGREGIGASRSASGAANRLARDQFNFDVFRDERGYPMLNIAGAGDVVRGLSDPYYTMRETGTDRRSQSPYTGSSGAETIAGGMSGAILGYQLGNTYSRNRTGGG
jgi:hypothetical protein